MKIYLCVIGLMCLFHVSIYAQNTGQVTLSIRLYPIQIIELEPANTQILEISNQEVSESINQSYSSQVQLSTYSTSQFELKVDTVFSNEFQKLRLSNVIPIVPSKSLNTIIDHERYNYEAEDELLHVVYCMETM